MKIDELDIPEEAKQIIKEDGIEELYPPQAEGIDDVISGKSCVFALPTASGKSLLAYVSLIKRVIEEGGKALYIVPLRALASEKVEDLKKFERLGINVEVSMGDYDNPDPSLKHSDVIVATSEKADSLLRQNVDWLTEINAVIADEVHLINDRNRGSTLEVTLSKLKQVNPDAQIVALSATIRNSEDIAKWLDAEHHKSEWRPVELRLGVFFEGLINFEDGETLRTKKTDAVPALCEPTIEQGDQCLVFVGTRRSTEAVSEQMSRSITKYLDEDEKDHLKQIAKEVRDNSSTSMGRRLASDIKNGTAFHHAGLNNYQRKAVENAFRAGYLKLISATPTLAAGINLPARRVVIRDCRRFDPLQGYNAPLPALEVKQMCGRAGRPGFDDLGEAILVAKRKSDAGNYYDNYIVGETEAIVSRLVMEPALRRHLLALIATGHCKKREELLEFIEETFFVQNRNISEIEDRVDKTLDMLQKEGLIEIENCLSATRFGEKVSDVYVDPLSAVMIRNAVDRGKMGIPLSYLHTICRTPDMYTFYITKSEMSKSIEKAESVRADLFEDIPQDEVELEDYLAAFKTAVMLNDWMREVPEDEIAEKYNIGPGDIRNKVETAEWLLHSAAEIAMLYNPQKSKMLREITERVKYGIKDELMPLMELEKVGRVRARTLYEAGYKTGQDVKNALKSKLMELDGIGERISNLGVEDGGLSSKHNRTDNTDKKEKEEESRGQSSLSDF
ncbi:MAG: DEAD/DEAH box helicase [Candidatus Saliniplasma sp.]